jgi:hypothetical protein
LDVIPFLCQMCFDSSEELADFVLKVDPKVKGRPLLQNAHKLYQTLRHRIPEDNDLHSHCRANLKYDVFRFQWQA